MHGNVYRAYAHFYYALNFPFAYVGEGDIIAEKEGQPGVVILEIQALAHSRRHLVDKAEHALIFAALMLVHQKALKLKSAGIARDKIEHPAVRLLYNKREPFALAVKAVIKKVKNLVTVYRDKRVAAPYPGAVK